MTGCQEESWQCLIPAFSHMLVLLLLFEGLGFSLKAASVWGFKDQIQGDVNTLIWFSINVYSRIPGSCTHSVDLGPAPTGVVPAAGAAQSWLLQQPWMLMMQRHRCWGNQRENTITDREFSGDLGYISRLQHRMQPGTLTASAMEFKRGSAECSLSIANCSILK